MARRKNDGSDVDAVFGMRIRSFRIAAGLKQRDLAKKLGVSHQQLQKYETGKNQVSINRLIDIANAIRVPVTDFFDDTNMKSNYDRQSLNLLKYFSNIEDEGVRRSLVNLIRILSHQDEA